MEVTPWLNGIILAPLAGALILGLIALSSSHKESRPPESIISIIACSGPIIACLISCWLFFQLLSDHHLIWHSHLLSWIQTSEVHVNLDFMMDHLSGLLVVMITFVGSLIHLFSTAYMKGDEGFARYFSYLNLFLCAMLILILSDNLVGMFLGWEGVGVCSYLLIGFWFKDIKKSAAGTKAFIVNRVGDFGFILGIFLIFILSGGSLDYPSLEKSLHLNGFYLHLTCFLLFVGAMGKSAQIPLHVWLPDAMAGPTPVSALIHAATMVTAGVYMVARLHFIYEHSPTVSTFIVAIGGLTALMAATIAMVQEDIKKVLAYSTVSQLGYMFMAVGVGAYTAGIFHLFTHAFFKALLFLGAGTIIYCLHHEQNLFKMGGLKSKLKTTYITMFIATLAISGIPPFAGFFSKDEILWSLWDKGFYSFWILGTLTAGLTAFYMFRLFFLAFGGNARHQHHVDQEPLNMKIPLLILAFGSTTVGFLGIPENLGGSNWIAHWLEPLFHHHTMSAEHVMISIVLMIVSVVAAITGWFSAYLFYIKNPDLRESLTPKLKLPILVFQSKYGFDEIYQAFVVQSAIMMGQAMYVFEKFVVDGVINSIPNLYRILAQSLQPLQSGKVRTYAYYILFGMMVLSYYYFLTKQPEVFY